MAQEIRVGTCFKLLSDYGVVSEIKDGELRIVQYSLSPNGQVHILSKPNWYNGDAVIRHLEAGKWKIVDRPVGLVDNAFRSR